MFNARYFLGVVTGVSSVEGRMLNLIMMSHKIARSRARKRDEVQQHPRGHRTHAAGPPEPHHQGLKPQIYVKADYMNPGGSVKDRIGITMIDEAERKGLLKPGGTIIEGTSGNTGMGLALVAAVRGYKMVFTITDKQSKEKVDLLKALGAEVIVCPTAVEPDDPRSYYSVAKKLAKRNSQFLLPESVRKSDESRGPLPDHRPGNLGRLAKEKSRISSAAWAPAAPSAAWGRYLKEKNPKIKIVGVDPDRLALLRFCEDRQSRQSQDLRRRRHRRRYFSGHHEF